MKHHINNYYLHGDISKYRRTRGLYIIEAALEYFFSLMLTGAYIAKVANTIGMSDALVGIISTASTLGCTFQLFALFLANKRPVKHWVFISHTINQLFFTAVWFIPLFDMNAGAKTIIFMVALIGGWIINHVINSPKISWYMSMVDNRKRGRFTAKKEMVSLVGGMVFTLAMSSIIDNLEASGNMRTAFLVGGFTMLGLTVAHSLTLIFSYERPPKKSEVSEGIFDSIKKLLKNKKLVCVLVFATVGKMAVSIAQPFYGTYQINELGFSLTFVSIIGVVHVGVRCLASVFMGKYADKTSFVNMLNVAYIFHFVGFVIMMFCTPSNGMITYTLYYAVLEAIFQAGFGNGVMNLVYDTVDKNERTGAFALYNAFSGLAGFLTTLLCSAVVSAIQASGNTVFGMSMYAQQFLSVVSSAVVAFSIVYMNTVLKMKFKKEKHNV